MTCVAYMKIGDFDRANLVEEQIRVAYISKLPYRLRVGTFKRYPIKGNTEVILNNTLDFPKEATEEQQIEYMQQQEKHHTNLLVLTPPTKVSNQEILELRREDEMLASSLGMLVPGIYSDRGNTSAMFMNTEPEIAAIFKHLMSVYYHTTRLKSTLNELRNYDHYHWHYQILITCPSNHVFNREEIDKLFSLCSLSLLTASGGVIPDLHDFDDAVLDALGGLLSSKPNFMFYQFALEAHSRFLGGDRLIGLLMLMIAYEGANAAFVHTVLEKRMARTPKKVHNAVDDYLRNVGLTQLNRMTPYLLMDPFERPSDIEIEGCHVAIETRNAIMHAKSSHLGDYKVNQFTDVKLWEDYQSVKIVYEKYVAAIERRNAAEEARASSPPSTRVLV